MTKFTMTVVKPGKLPCTFLKPFSSLADATHWAWNEIATEDVMYILIREGEDPSDPVVWDSRDNVEHVVSGKPIWTHTPVPAGFPLQTVNARFEKRAACVLSDYDSPVSFDTWTPALPTEKSDQYDILFDDGRYVDVGVRTAWMMYLDLELAHFDRFGLVV